jgi:hypothetical protein
MMVMVHVGFSMHVTLAFDPCHAHELIIIINITITVTVTLRRHALTPPATTMKRVITITITITVTGPAQPPAG